MTMRWILFIAILAIAIILFGVTIVIIALKGQREARAKWRRRARRRLEPGLLRYLGTSGGGPEADLPRFVSVPARGSGRAAMVEFLLEHSEVVKGEALERITKALEELGIVDREIRRLGSRSWWRRAAAAERLGLTRSTRAIESLADALEDDNPEVRLRAARALGQIRGLHAVRPLVAALSKPSRWSTLRVADILGTMGEDVEQELITSYTGMPRVSRLATMDILGRLRRPGSVTFLEQRLRDEDPDIRARAVHALGQISEPSIYRSLLTAMSDPEWPVRAMAAKALGRLRVPEAVDVLVSGLRDRQWWVRSNSAEALRELGERGARALLDMLDSPDTYARHQAVLMLEEAGVIDRYAAGLRGQDEEAVVARAVVSKLVKMGRIERLEEISRTHPEPPVREALAAILKLGPARPAGGMA